MDYGVQGTVAVVTGGAQGIGRAIVAMLAAGGAKVVLGDINDDRAKEVVTQAKAAGGETSYFHAAVTDEGEVKSLIRFAVDTYGRLDCAINSAGINTPNRPMAELEYDEIRRVVDVDLHGMFLCMKYEIQALLGHGGAVVNISSGAGLRGHYGIAAYAAAKHGVNGLTKSAALDYALHGIRVNCICPGAVETDMFKVVKVQAPDKFEMFSKLNPMGRLVQPEEVAHAALWLCSEGASMINGIELVIDGGSFAH